MISGIVCIRNNFKLGYMMEECIKSLLPVCDEVVVSECESEDGTRRFLDVWAHVEPKLKVVNYKWTNPKGDKSWWPTWINDAKSHASFPTSICIDADEVLHENSYPIILEASKHGRAIIAHRYNFWRDARHLIPHGFCCGHEVIRVGPTRMFFPSDYEDPLGRDKEICAIAQRSHPPVEFMHYGFLRERAKFFQKAKVVQGIWANDYDPRLEAADKAGGNWMANSEVASWVNDVVPFTGTHPRVARQWLSERGYEI